MRLVQGFGAGAEYGGAVVFVVEYAPPGKRGIFASWAPMGVVVGNLLAAGVFAVVDLLPREELLAWGWRLPLFRGLCLPCYGASRCLDRLLLGVPRPQSSR